VLTMASYERPAGINRLWNAPTHGSEQHGGTPNLRLLLQQTSRYPAQGVLADLALGFKQMLGLGGGV
jgi:hypothetical protein